MKISLESLVCVLRAGGVLLMPTETAYGLLADAKNPKAVARIFSLKQRGKGNPLPLIVSSTAMAKRYVKLSPALQKLAKKYWPGPLTIVAPTFGRNGLTKEAVGKDGQIALRVSSDPFVRKLVRRFGGPVTATSANLSGQKECYSVDVVSRQFGDKMHKIDFVVDAGHLKKQKPSTVVKEEDGKLIVLRKGPIIV